MFVAIDNKNMDVFKVEEWINTNRDANGGVISPEFAMEILVKTNFYGNIKKVINHIKKNCLDENGELIKDKVLAYKDFILSCVDGREMSQQALEVLQDLADACGIREEFDEINDKEPKEYDRDDCMVVTIKNKDDLDNLEEGGYTVYVGDAYLVQKDFSKVKKLKFPKGSKVDLYGATNLPKDLEFSDNPEVNLSWTEFENVKFMDGAEVNLNHATLPQNLDVSMCAKVEFNSCELAGLRGLKFRDGAVVHMHRAKSLPDDLDVSMCSWVSLTCDLRGVKELKFRDGAVVNLKTAKNFPKFLDFSKCSKVYLNWSDLSGVEQIKFRDKEQQEEFMEEAEKFSGKIEYVGNEKSKNLVNSSSGMVL